MTLAQVVKSVQDDLNAGIAWIAIWRDGRSWDSMTFFQDDGSYEDGYTFDKDDIAEMKNIYENHRNAIMLNGYYCNCGADPEGVGDGLGTLKSIQAGIEWNFYNHYNTFIGFYDQWVINKDE